MRGRDAAPVATDTTRVATRVTVFLEARRWSEVESSKCSGFPQGMTNKRKKVQSSAILIILGGPKQFGKGNVEAI